MTGFSVELLQMFVFTEQEERANHSHLHGLSVIQLLSLAVRFGDYFLPLLHRRSNADFLVSDSTGPKNCCTVTGHVKEKQTDQLHNTVP